MLHDCAEKGFGPSLMNLDVDTDQLPVKIKKFTFLHIQTNKIFSPLLFYLRRTVPTHVIP
jgi:hypothetical protein